MQNEPTADQIAEILAFEARQQAPVTTTVLFAPAERAVADRAPQTAEAAAYDMAGWTTVANERVRHAAKRARA